MMRRPMAVLFMAASLAGCSSSNKVSADQAAKFEPGKTNELEVVGVLGQPLESIKQADGTKIEQYPLDAASGGGWLSGMFGNGASESRYGRVSFVYAADGTLKSIDGVPK